jgi:hypothetical protein
MAICFDLRGDNRVGEDHLSVVIAVHNVSVQPLRHTFVHHSQIGHGSYSRSVRPIPDDLPQKRNKGRACLAQLSEPIVAFLPSFIFLRLEPAIISLDIDRRHPVAQLISALGTFRVTHRFFKA